MSWLSEYIRKQSGSAQSTSGKTVKEIAMQGMSAALDKGVELFRKTPTGSALEQTATKQKITEIVSNPIFIIGAVVFGYLIIRGMSR